MRLFVLALLLLLAGCQTSGPLPPPTLVTWNRNIAAGSSQWARLAEEKFHKPVVVFSSHGATAHGVWCCFPDWAHDKPVPVEIVARLLKSAFPDHVIVLMVCNEGGETLHVPGVIYSKMTVWTHPGDRARPIFDVWSPGFVRRDVGAGSMNDFVEGQR